jgi:hypothetical protein
VGNRVVNEHIEEQGSQDRSLRNTGENFKRRGKNTRNTDLKFPIGQVTEKPVYIATRKLKSTKWILMHNNNSVQFISFLVYLHINSTAQEPITKHECIQ